MERISYADSCQLASEAQGITALVDALSNFGITATSEQTGGFTMAAYIPVTIDTYIYANPYGASFYTIEDYASDIVQYDTPQEPNLIALAVSNYINKGE